MSTNFYPEEMSLVECEDRAKDEGYNTATFDIVGPRGRIGAKWLDAYFGLFQVDGEDGFQSVDRAKHTFGLLGLHCENFKAQP